MADLTTYTEAVRRAEQLDFDAVILRSTTHLDELAADPRDASSLEPITVLSAVAARTSEIGLIAPVATTLTQPYTIARRLSALDFVSSGRAGWQPLTPLIEAELANLGWTELTVGQAHDRAAEYVDVVTKLWHSWRLDARVIDKAAGLYLDLDRVNAVNHQGRYFQVSGPIDSPRPPQGNPVLVTADPPERWSASLSRTVDVVIAEAVTTAVVETTSTALTSILDAVGRDRSTVRFIPTFGVAQIEEAVRLHDDGVIDGATFLVDARVEQPVEALERLSADLASAALTASSRASTLRGRLGLLPPAERFEPSESVAPLQPVNG